jgi:hypothetical protein
MSDADIEQAVRKFDKHVRDVERVTDVMFSVLSMEPECELNSALHNIVNGYIDAIDEKYGFGFWLEWWWIECDLGNKPMKAGVAGKEPSIIASIDDLVRLIIDSSKSKVNV